MYICICNAITDSDIHEAVESGVRDLGQLKMETGCSGNCGFCEKAALEVLRQALAGQPAVQTRVAGSGAA
jgi:bacterioferritin-associated ferredoxin